VADESDERLREARRQAGTTRAALLQVPTDPQIRIWRYMDFTKLLSMLEDNALFFTRADLFEDAFEGSYPEPNPAARLAAIGPKLPETAPPWQHEDAERARKMIGESFGDFFRALREHFFVNCWHMNEHESAAMWKLYGESSYTIAVQSRYDLLRKCLPCALDEFGNPKDGHIDVAAVKYIDYAKEAIPEGYMFSAFIHKRKSFEHERELRAFFQTMPEPAAGRFIMPMRDRDGNLISLHEGPRNKEPYVKPAPYEPGRLVPADLNTLVEAVFVAPAAPTWFFELVKKVCARYQLAKPVEQSSLDAQPIY
jgi:hypothetical protein